MAGFAHASATSHELRAPASWRTLEFVSDVHLSADDASTATAWAGYLSATEADAVFVLGDLFEVWTGDDLIAAESQGFIGQRLAELRRLSLRSAVFFMRGNRDFLAGEDLMQACGAELLDDPCVLVLPGRRVLLSHGDALCLDDARYMEFRAQVRSAAWQQAFLAQPLADRQALARQLREQSRQEQARSLARGQLPADVNDAAASALLQTYGAELLVHGHTHRPGRHRLAGGHREVLSDWDALAHPPRAQVLRMRHAADQGWTLERQNLLPA
jgi:UDP-2,3-diacylglucosamine hydrolase